VNRKKIWIDLDNTPHIPFFAPIMEQLQQRGFSLVVTARDCFQVCGLADLFQLKYKRLGRHYGRHKLLKGLGLTVRALQLLPTALWEKPDLSLSHGSRSQLMVSALLGIPSITILDYEFASFLPLLRPTWVMVPELIPNSAIRTDKDTVLRYPGIKEDVYVPTLKPDPGILAELGLGGNDVIVTARPPANEAHYYNPESSTLFNAAMDVLSSTPGVRIVMLPRNAKQGSAIRDSWPQLFSNGTMVIPERAIDGLNLVWHSDLVISGGGTMNREAAALKVPVYSVFRGTIGAVDRYLASCGRLVLLESVEDVRSKLVVMRRDKSAVTPQLTQKDALGTIVNHITEVVERPSKTSVRPPMREQVRGGQ
jgi:uncharacterized protein